MTKTTEKKACFQEIFFSVVHFDVPNFGCLYSMHCDYCSSQWFSNLIVNFEKQPSGNTWRLVTPEQGVCTTRIHHPECPGRPLGDRCQAAFLQREHCDPWGLISAKAAARLCQGCLGEAIFPQLLQEWRDLFLKSLTGFVWAK